MDIFFFHFILGADAGGRFDGTLFDLDLCENFPWLWISYLDELMALSSLHYSTISLVRLQLLFSSFAQLCIDVYLVAAASALAANTVFRSAAGAVFPVRLSFQALTVDTWFSCSYLRHKCTPHLIHDGHQLYLAVSPAWWFLSLLCWNGLSSDFASENPVVDCPSNAAMAPLYVLGLNLHLRLPKMNAPLLLPRTFP